VLPYPTMETVGPKVALTVGRDSGQEAEEGTLDDIGSRVYN
jgi:hypothetical protein